MKQTLPIDWQQGQQNNNAVLQIITTGRGYFKAGLKGKIIAAAERSVLMGETIVPLPEFTIELDSGDKREFCQYGRDFVFLASAT